MLERLRVRNFRGLNDVTVDKLSHINLVTGRNNAGKTTLIEAVLLLVGAANARMAFSPHVIRGFRQGMPPRWVADTSPFKVHVTSEAPPQTNKHVG